MYIYIGKLSRLKCYLTQRILLKHIHKLSPSQTGSWKNIVPTAIKTVDMTPISVLYNVEKNWLLQCQLLPFTDKYNINRSIQRGPNMLYSTLDSFCSCTLDSGLARIQILLDQVLFPFLLHFSKFFRAVLSLLEVFCVSFNLAFSAHMFWSSW